MKLFDFNNFRKDSISAIIGHKYSGKSELCKYLLKNLKFQDGTILTKNNFPYQDINNCNFITDLDEIPTGDFFIMDNIFDDNWISNSIIKEIFLYGRNLKLTTFLSMVYPYHVHPILRYNMDYVFVLKTHNVSMRKRIYEMYGGIFDSLEQFNKYMNELKDYDCLVINLQSFHPLEDSVFLLRHEL